MDHAEEAVTASHERSRDLDALARRLRRGYRTIGEKVYEIIRTAILQGTFTPGQRLRQDELATAIGVSRVPVRAALVRLDAEGLLSYQGRRGAVVSILPIHRVREIYRLRELLECHALRLSIERLTPDRAARIRRLAKELDAQRPGSQFQAAGTRFYRELYDGASNPKLVEIIEELRASIEDHLEGLRLVHELSSHGALVEHVLARDADKAEAYLREHLEAVRLRLEEVLLSEDPAPDADGGAEAGR